MSDSQPNSEVFTVRIVSIDHYMAPPIPAIDISYSTFQGITLNPNQSNDTYSCFIPRLHYSDLPCTDFGIFCYTKNNQLEKLTKFP